MAARSVLDRPDPDARELRDLVDGALLDLRGAIQVLHADVEADPHEALTEVLAAFRYRIEGPLCARGIALDWHLEPLTVPGLVTSASLIGLLRIVQEAFTNILKHSGANRAGLSTRMEGGNAVLTIYDNGIGGIGGIEPDSPGIGVGSMMRRASKLGAMLSLQSGREGTAIEIVFAHALTEETSPVRFADPC